MIVKAKYKICKRLGNGVFEKCQTQKFALAEARAQNARRQGGKRPKALSDFGKQMLEKQRVRFTYGIAEKQFARYVKDATLAKEPAARLLELLENRLDNVVYRLGLANTRSFARQLATHGHITVNGKKIDVPSHQVKKGDVVAVRSGSKEKRPFQESLTERMKNYTAPNWLSFDAAKLAGEITGQPTKDNTEMPYNLGSVVEFYNK